VYSSPDFIRVIKSRRMRWAGHVEGMGARRGTRKVLGGKETAWKTEAQVGG
jgi:hypothetical protein